MGIKDFIKGQLIDVIQYTTDDKSILAHKFEDGGKQIMMGAKLTVRPGQKAIFVNEGQIADIFNEGLYTLDTSNMPILTKLKSWKYGFESPFKVDIYFISADEKIEQPWGTPSKIAVRDPDFGIIRIGSNGYYNYKIVDPGVFLIKLVGTDREFTVEECRKQLNSEFTMSFTDFFGESKVTLFDAYGNIKEFSQAVFQDVKPKFTQFGLELISFTLREIRVPQVVEEAMDSRAQIGAMGGMDMYQRKTMTDAMAKSSVNMSEHEGGSGLAGMGMQVATGVTMGSMMSGMMAGSMNTSGNNTVQNTSGAGVGLIVCPNCNASANTGTKFCPQCGGSMEPKVETVTCVKCSASIKKGAKFCPECGAKQVVQSPHCTNCGAEMSAGGKFCPQCGNKQ